MEHIILSMNELKLIFYSLITLATFWLSNCIFLRYREANSWEAHALIFLCFFFTEQMQHWYSIHLWGGHIRRALCIAVIYAVSLLPYFNNPWGGYTQSITLFEDFFFFFPFIHYSSPCMLHFCEFKRVPGQALFPAKFQSSYVNNVFPFVLSSGFKMMYHHAV